MAWLQSPVPWVSVLHSPLRCGRSGVAVLTWGSKRASGHTLVFSFGKSGAWEEIKATRWLTVKAPLLFAKSGGTNLRCCIS